MNAQLDLEFTYRRRPERPYYPTTPLSREEEQGAIRVAQCQDEAVLAIFRAATGAMSPSQVYERGIALGRQWLLTSVRRSITNLTKDAQVLVHLETHVQGPWGKPEGLWILAGREARR